MTLGRRSALRPIARRARHAMPRLLRDRNHDVLPPIPPHELGCEVPDDLLRLLLSSVGVAAEVDLSHVAAVFPLPEDREYITRWPGEHYRLLHGLGRVLQPELVVEVGTYRGAAARVLGEVSSRVVTYDVVPIHRIPGAPEEGFGGHGNVEQRIGDLKDPGYFDSQRGTLEEASLVFVDGPKDAIFEQGFVPRLTEILRPGAVLVLDDIRFRCMQSVWRGLPLPRLDMGGFGHWSGTGVALAQDPERMQV